MRKIDSKHKHEKGASAIEYALLLACLVLVMVTALTSFGDQIKTSIGELQTKVQERLGGNGGG